MKFSRRRLLLAVLVGVVALAAWGLLQPHGPTYQGRDVRGWLALESGTDGDKLEEFEFGPDSIPAIRAMGTNAFPELIEIALEGLPKKIILAASFEERLPGLLERLPGSFYGWLRYSGVHIPNYAMAAVGALRPPAALVFPAFTNAIARSRSPGFLSGKMWAEEYDRGFAFRLLGYVGDERETAARMLAPFLVSTNGADSMSAMGALAKLGPVSAVAVPQLVVCLTNTSKSFGPMFCLRRIGPGASNALPQLRRNYLAENKPDGRRPIAFTALAIEPPGGWGEAAVRTMFAVGGDEKLCGAALDWLKDQTNSVPRFEPELAALARTGKQNLAWPALDALVKANLGSDRTSPVLSECLLSTNMEVRVSAAGWLLELQPTNSLAFEAVTNAFAGDQFGDGTGRVTRYWLMTCLAKLGPAAAPALPLIRKYYSDAPYARDRIAAAIRAIEGKN